MFKRLSVSLALAFALQAGMAAAAPDSARLGRAKDYIADEQWARAIAELRTAVADPKETSKDEALYWLAHSLNQSGDSAAAIATIRRLERDYPASLWVKPAGSLRLDIAVHLQRNDVLWWTAVPPPAPPASGPACRTAVAPRRRPRRARLARWPRASPAPRAPPARSRRRPPGGLCRRFLPHPPAWLPEFYRPDTDLRIQALGSLIQTDAVKVIPMLCRLPSTTATCARRAGRSSCWRSRASPRPAASVVQVAQLGPIQCALPPCASSGASAAPTSRRS